MSGSFSRLMATPAFKFVVLGVLTLALMIPLLLVFLIVGEREGYSRAAVTEVGRKWGRAQAISGPYIVVPLEREAERVDRQGVKTSYTQRKYAVLLPEMLNIKSDVTADQLKRGIYDVPVYTTALTYKGAFKAADLASLTRDNYQPRYDEIVMSLFVADVRGIKETTKVVLSGGGQGEPRDVRFEAGTGVSNARPTGIHIPLSRAELMNEFGFEFQLPVKGTNFLKFEPSGGETHVSMSSNWPHPSFTGNFLPIERTITAEGFTAKWQVPQLARGGEQIRTTTKLNTLMAHNQFGVQFYQPVGFYDLVGRALKYAVAFIAAVFLLVFIMEVYVGRPVHWIQYVFVGFALLIFYLVLLGLAEHVGFEVAYGVASLATALLIGLYSASALKAPAKGIFLGVIIALLYGLLYMLLRVEDYALLIGSIASFFMLSGLMYMTRNVDWSGYKLTPEDPRSAP